MSAPASTCDTAAGTKSPERLTALYRLHSSAGDLLYVGIGDPYARIKSHHRDKPWSSDIDFSRTTISWYTTRAEAGAAETAAIKSEMPRHNVVHSVVPTPTLKQERKPKTSPIDGRMTADEAAAHMGITRRTLFNLAGTREDFPKPLHVGRTPLWLPTDLDAWRVKHPARKKREAPPG